MDRKKENNDEKREECNPNVLFCFEFEEKKIAEEIAFNKEL